MPAAEFVDLYEILQVSPNAEKDTIKRVHQILSLKYQLASQGNTGNSDFARLQEAAATLLDTETRAKYDQERQTRLATTAPTGAAHGMSGSPVQPIAAIETPAAPSAANEGEPVPSPQSAADPTSAPPAEEPPPPTMDPHRFMEGLDIREECRKRAGLVEICYRQRILKPRQPALSVKQLEDGLYLTVAEMEASMWYLKETELLRVSDAGNYAITTKGMDAIEGGFIRFADALFDMKGFNR